MGLEALVWFFCIMCLILEKKLSVSLLRLKRYHLSGGNPTSTLDTSVQRKISLQDRPSGLDRLLAPPSGVKQTTFAADAPVFKTGV